MTKANRQRAVGELSKRRRCRGSDDLSNRICKHPDRIHSVGADTFVCFKCWLGLLFPGAKHIT